MVTFNGGPFASHGWFAPPAFRIFLILRPATGRMPLMNSLLRLKGGSSAAVVLLAVLLTVAGCGGDPLGRHAISGTVSVDGAPLDKGNIAFTPLEKSSTSSGTVIEGGKYSIKQDKGLPVGKYRVTINAPVPGTGGAAQTNAPPGEAIPPPQEMIAPEWNEKSEQSIEVTEKGPYQFNFDAKKKGK